MIAFDTNHLLRHILQDDVKQCAKVAELLRVQAAAGESIRLLDLVIMETCWVLQSVYGLDRVEWCEVLESLLGDAAFAFDDPIRLRKTVEWYRQGSADFDDYLILGQARAMGAELKTFDKKLLKSM